MSTIDTRMDSTRRASAAMARMTCLCVAALLASPAWSHPPDDDHTHIKQQDSGTEHRSLGDVGAKLSDPTSNLWQVSMSFQGLQFFDGDVNSGDPKLGGGVNLQPVMPFPLFGEEKDQWKFLTWPIIPIVFNLPTRRGSTSSRIGAAWGTSSCPCS